MKRSGAAFRGRYRAVTRGRKTLAEAQDVPQSVHVPVLPQELIDVILSFLDNDRETLRECSLVSRAWAHSTSAHLFKRRRWPKCEHHWSRKRTVSHCSCASDLRVARGALVLLGTFFEGSARVCNAVRDLRFSFTLIQLNKAPMGVLVLDVLLDVLALLPNLRSVFISNINGHSAAEKDRSTGRATRKLKKLEIENALHLDQYALASIVGFFASVEEVVIRRAEVSLPEDPPHYPAIGEERTQVSALTFDRCRASSVGKYLDALTIVIIMSSLAHLSISRPVGTGYSQSLLPFLDLAPQLDAFLYDCDVSLPPLPTASSSRPGEISRHVAELLAHCSARAVTLVLVVQHSAQPDVLDDLRNSLRDLDWAPIDAAAANAERLEKVRLRYGAGIERAHEEPLDESPISILKTKLSPKVFGLLRL